ncbi:unnamed protein product, partial [Discosporangium mesarthrocarpum]
MRAGRNRWCGGSNVIAMYAGRTERPVSLFCSRSRKLSLLSCNGRGVGEGELWCPELARGNSALVACVYLSIYLSIYLYLYLLFYTSKQLRRHSALYFGGTD